MHLRSQKTKITDLPDEVLLCIAEVVDYWSLVDFACTSRRFAAATESQLARMRRLCSDNLILQDRHPLTIINTLRAILKDPEQAWRIREVEAWGLRTKWSQWTTYGDLDMYSREEALQDPEYTDEGGQIGGLSILPEGKVDMSHLDSTFYEHKELEQLRHVIKDTLHLDCADEWIKLIKSGDDEPLRAILYSLLPRLQRIGFVMYPTWTFAICVDRAPMKRLNEVIEACCKAAKTAGNDSVWPPGLRRLQIAEVGAGTGYRHPHDAFCAQPHEFEPLFRLPRLRKVFLGVAGYEHGDDDKIHIEPRSSSIEELEVYCCSLDDKFYIDMVRGIKTLRALNMMASEVDNKDEFGNFLLKEHGNTIEFLDTRPLEWLEKFTHLRQVTLDAQDMYESLSGKPLPEYDESPPPERPEQYIPDDQYALHRRLPKGVKMLKLQQSAINNPLAESTALLYWVRGLIEARNPLQSSSSSSSSSHPAEETYTRLADICWSLMQRERADGIFQNVEMVQKVEDRSMFGPPNPHKYLSVKDVSDLDPEGFSFQKFSDDRGVFLHLKSPEAWPCDYPERHEHRDRQGENKTGEGVPTLFAEEWDPSLKKPKEKKTKETLAA